MEHSFHIEVAAKYGVHEAVFIHNLYFWILKNECNGRHFYEGRSWTYNSLTALEKLFPYFTRKQIRTIIANCEKKGAVICGSFNKEGYDKTKWFALSDEVLRIYQGNIETCPNGHEEPEPCPNGNEGCPNGQKVAETYAQKGQTYAQKGTAYAQKGTTIPDSKPDIYNIFSSETDEDTQKKKRVYEPESTPYRIAAYLLAAILKNKPDFRCPSEAAFQKWADSARLMIERDKRDKRRIKEVIDFCQDDPFWRRNILSVPKLREKFDQLELQLGPAPPQEEVSTREAARRMYER